MSKVILITGASSGLGLHIATYLSNKKHIVYGTSRLEGAGSNFTLLKMDVTNEESIKEAIDLIIDKNGRIDVLVNNAGLGIAGPIENLLMNDVQRVIDTNVLGVIRMCQAVLPSMRESHSGKIINISSIGSETGLPYRGLYSASKAAVDRITEALRVELFPFGIQACYIQPGGVQTEINRNRIKTAISDDTVYKRNFEHSYELIDKSVATGLSPNLFGPLVEKIINANYIKRCYRVGKPIEKLSVIMKKLLSSKSYDQMIRNHYNIT